MAKYIFTLIAVCFLIQCKNTSAPTPQLQPIEIQKVVDKMTEIMVHDITNPPLAARFFSYACLAGYEVAAEHETTLRPMQGVLNEYPTIEKPNIKEAYAPTLATVVAMMETAKKLQPSGHLMEEFEKKYLDSCQNIGFSKPVIENSIQYAKAISEQILKYAKADKYNRISNYPRYTPSVGDGFWYPTPPGYMAAVEPYFNTVRPFSLDSAAQFKPEPPAVFSTDKKSVFYQLMNAVYSQNMSDEHKAIASFWDCNPFALDDNGHLMVALKKISPGAHWMGIAGIACQKTKADFSKNIQVHTLVAMGLMDGFICCWDEKYRSNRVRPETVIRKFIDPNWKPFLQTPPFPEYLSGHSTISSTSATILTHFFGDNFAYDDTVEERYGLKARPFSSFKKAASEAGISRFYGGIHYMDAIENGQKQGELVGNNVLKRYLNKN
jgi:hypothetical protein